MQGTTASSITAITADDDALRAVLRHADLPSLLASLAHATGDLSLLQDDLRPTAISRLVPQGGLDEARQERARELALGVLQAARDGGWPAPAAPGEEELLAPMRYLVGHAMDDYLPLLRDELMLTGDPAAPTWRKQDVAPERPFSVVVVGAGMSGLAVGHRLRQAGVPFTIVEKNDDVGGTWLENTYPGCRVDVSNHLYSYTFAQRQDWPHYFSTQDVLLDYFRSFADQAGLRPHICFGTEVLAAAYDDERCRWTVRVRRPDGTEESMEAEAVVTAVGQLNRPSLPDIDGVGSFAGPTFHSARWDHSVDLAGKRVAVIGTGASAFQFVPIIAEEVADLTVFQRTPPWTAPAPNYHHPVADGLQWLFRHVPSYAQWYRFWLFCSSVEGILPSAYVDPDWDVSERSVSKANDDLRALLTLHIRRQYEDRPDLADKVVPDYPPAAKRMLKDNGDWARTLKRDHVHLVTTPIERVTEKAVVTADGTEHEADVLVYATGFKASDFLTPMQVTGRGGVDLHQRWDGDARAYLGISVPGFPNLFCVYGPNTNIVVNGSIIFFSECASTYILGAIRALLEGEHRAIDVREDVHDAFNERVDAENRLRAWGSSDVNAWYRNALGRVSQNWPFSLMEYWQATKAPDLDAYEVL